MHVSYNKFVVAAILVLLFHTALLAFEGTRSPGPILSDLTQLAANILAAAACFYWFRRSQQFARRFWFLFCLYFSIWSIASVAFDFHVYLFHKSLIPASLTDLLFFLTGAPAGMALFIESGPRSQLRERQWLIDCIQVALVVAAGYFYFIYAPAYAPATPFDDEAVRQRIENGFIIRNAILTAAFLLRAFFASRSIERQLFGMAAAYFVPYTVLTARADYEVWAQKIGSGTWIDLTWSVPALLITVLAANWRELPAEEQPEDSYSRVREFFRFFAPSIPVFLVVLMSIHMPQRYSWMAMMALLLSFVAFAIRLGVTQYGQRLGEQALHGSLSLLEATLESTADGILVVDRNGKIVSFNHRFIDLWRIPQALVEERDEAKTLNFVLDQLKDPEHFLARVSELYSRPHEEGYDVIQFKDDRFYERYSKPQYVEGRAVGRVWSFRDISQRWFLEAQLRHSQKLEAVGRLAGGIAHDFNNVLTVMTGYLQLALNHKQVDPAITTDLREVQKAVDHASSLTKQLLAFSRQQVLLPQVLDLNERITSLLQILGRLISQDIQLATRFEPGLGPVLIDQTQLEQVIMNLAVNARDAMPNGGSLSFETRSLTLDSAYCRDHPSATPGKYSILVITDTGEGIEPEIMAHIFDPFFTTKQLGKGTGLGLSTVYGIVQQAGGFIEVTSEVGSGTTISVFFPQVDSVVRPLKPKQHVTRSLQGNETVLILEDNEDLRQLTSKILGLNGYKVLEADSGAEAETICRDYPGKIDLILSDVVMPGVKGPEIVTRLCSIRPNLRAIFMSGFIDDRPIAEAVLTDTTDFMQKPFGPTALLAKVREVLDAAAVHAKKMPV